MVETAVKPSQRLNFHGFESYSNMRDLDLQLLTLMKVLLMMLMLRMDAKLTVDTLCDHVVD